MNRLILAIAFGLLTLPGSAAAMQTFHYEFAQNQVNATWGGFGAIHMQKAPEGVILATDSATGAFVTTTLPTFAAQGGRISADAETPQSAYFVWFLTADPTGATFSVPVAIGTGLMSDTSFPLKRSESWIPGEVQRLGIVLPPHSQILLRSIELYRWNAAEKVINAILSVGTFGAYRPTAINFVWGPQVAWNPIERAVIDTASVPTTTSFTYALTIILLILCLAWVIQARRKSNGLAPVIRRIAAVAAVFWVLLDLRMGGEFLSWVWADTTQYIAASPVTRTFRERNAFYDFADFVHPLVADRETYTFFGEQQWPYLGNLRYITYPAIPGMDIEHDDTIVVYRRPDIRISESNQLMVGEQAFTEPGTVLGRFDTDSFVFRVSR